MRFTQHLDPHSHPYPSAKSLLPPIVKSLPPRHSIFLPSANFPSASLHPLCPFAKPLHPAPRPHSTPPISSHFFAPQDFLSQVPLPRTSPRIPSCPSPCAPTPFHTTHFHRTSLLPRVPLAKFLPPSHSIFLPSANFPSASLHPPCSSAKPLHPAP